jgi:hypothetical protein
MQQNRKIKTRVSYSLQPNYSSHSSGINSLISDNLYIYSASRDGTIIQWSHGYVPKGNNAQLQEQEEQSELKLDIAKHASTEDELLIQSHNPTHQEAMKVNKYTSQPATPTAKHARGPSGFSMIDAGK